jgi:hypothetical protein
MKNLVNVFQDTLENSKGLTKSITSKHTFDEINNAKLGMSVLGDVGCLITTLQQCHNISAKY